MMDVDIKGLLEKLNPVLKTALEGAAGLAMTNGHFNVEIEHWLLKVMEHPHTDLNQIIEKAELEKEHLVKELQLSVSEFKSGNTRPPAFSENIVRLITQTWLICSSEFEDSQISSGHLITALFLDNSLAAQIKYSSPTLASLTASKVKELAVNTIGNTTESSLLNQSQGTTSTASMAPGGTSALQRFTIDLTQKARDGEIDQVIGRDPEIRQIVDILLRRRQNNPILTGEAGVGKTAAVEGFAKAVVDGEVPEVLQDVKILSLDMGLLEAGASVKGEFENRLKNVIKEIKESPDSIILFVDEAHSLVGAGGREGQGDAANLMKPALARGELRTIAATTWAEYKKYFEKDPALTRRFQVVKIEEPEIDTAINMMRAISQPLAKHHKVRILDEAIEASVKLSSRYIPSRLLPDKAVSLLDTACAKVALSQSTTPAIIDSKLKSVELFKKNLELLNDEQNRIGGVEEKITFYKESIESLETDLESLNQKWHQEQEFSQQISEVTIELEANPESEELLAKVTELRAELHKAQGDEPMIHLEVSQATVAEVVSSWTGIPVGKMATTELTNVLALADSLKERVKGQDHSLNAIAEAINISRAGLTDPRKPKGVFLLIGPSGTGKTETALSLAEMMFGGEQNVVTINMSEFKEEHKVSMLLGAPAGYVGYGEGGVLTEAVRRKPYSVVLLDEMEKAHPGIQDIFYNLFDKGTIKDGQGQDIDFKNTIIIMTSNACSGAISDICESAPETSPEDIIEQVRPELLEHFRPAFLGRTKIIPYYSLSKDVLSMIVDINLNRIRKRISENYKAESNFTADLKSYIVSSCNDPDTGARNVENIVERLILPALAKDCLGKISRSESFDQVTLDYKNDELVISF